MDGVCYDESMQIDIDAEKRKLQELAERASRDDERAEVELTPGWSLGIRYVGPDGEREWTGFRGSSWDDLVSYAAIATKIRRDRIESEKKAAERR